MGLRSAMPATIPPRAPRAAPIASSRFISSRNGGLLVDLGVIRPHAPIDPLVRHEVSSELVVEWRALTVALMDPLVDLVRARLDLDASFTMPKMLQGGTWSAGRGIARELRPPDGPSPIPVAADGTVF